MSLLPYLLGASMDELMMPAVPALFRPGSIFDHLALGAPLDEAAHARRASTTSSSSVGPMRQGHLHPWRHTPIVTGFLHHPHPHGGHPLHRAAGAAAQRKKAVPHAFKVNLDVQQFKPEEISVKVVDGFIVVEAKHEERPDEHGLISREFQRRYKIPEDVDLDALSSKLSSDGVLSIEAPKKSEEPPSKDRVIPIVHTNAPAVTTQPQEKKEKSANKESLEKMDQ